MMMETRMMIIMMTIKPPHDIYREQQNHHHDDETKRSTKHCVTATRPWPRPAASCLVFVVPFAGDIIAADPRVPCLTAGP